LSIIKSKTLTIWLYRGLRAKISSDLSVDIVLTPDLYLMKEEALPVKFSFEARRVALSLLEELGANSSWIFQALKAQDGKWLLFAYNPKLLEQTLKEANIDLNRVRKIYFAQQFKEYLTKPVLLNENRALSVVNGKVTILPASIISSKTTLPYTALNSLPKPKESFNFHYKSKGVLLGSKEALIATTALTLLGIAYLIEGFWYKSEIKKTQKELEAIYDKEPSLASKITRDNIYQKYKEIDTHQRAIRDILKRIGNLIGKESRLNSLKITGDSFIASIDAPKSKISTLERLAKEMGFRVRLLSSGLELSGGIE